MMCTLKPSSTYTNNRIVSLLVPPLVPWKIEESLVWVKFHHNNDNNLITFFLIKYLQT